MLGLKPKIVIVNINTFGNEYSKADNLLLAKYLNMAHEELDTE